LSQWSWHWHRYWPAFFRRAALLPSTPRKRYARNSHSLAAGIVCTWEAGPGSEVLLADKKGRKHLEAEMASWEQMSNAVALILRTAE
jgi:hypothetical protein